MVSLRMRMSLKHAEMGTAARNFARCLSRDLSLRCPCTVFASSRKPSMVPTFPSSANVVLLSPCKVEEVCRRVFGVGVLRKLCSQLRTFSGQYGLNLSLTVSCHCPACWDADVEHSRDCQPDAECAHHLPQMMKGWPAVFSIPPISFARSVWKTRTAPAFPCWRCTS